MDPNRQAQVVLIFFALAIAACIPLVVLITYDIVSEINDKHPNMGFIGWAGIASWVGIGFAIAECAQRLCKRKSRALACTSAGMAAAGVYGMLTALVIALSVTYFK